MASLCHAHYPVIPIREPQVNPYPKLHKLVVSRIQIQVCLRPCCRYRFEVIVIGYLFLPRFLSSTPPIIPAATATPLTMATPINPSLATLSSINVRKFEA